MQNQKFSEEKINDIILKYADGTLNVRDTAKLELLVKHNHNYIAVSRINRKIRLQLQSLPKLKAADDFEARLSDRLEKEY